MQKPSEIINEIFNNLNYKPPIDQTRIARIESVISIIKYLDDIIPQLQQQIEELNAKINIQNQRIDNLSEQVMLNIKITNKPKYTCPNCWRSDLEEPPVISFKYGTWCKYCFNKDKK